ncbi:MAG: shikimate dehydrogenase [Pseudomonadales bacterium]|nr:shikimate dehydrogenase [Pseudomonadales bacterium]MDP4639709.1 shikimate dehydrogenase [Pseudomonadales bacterium]MDP4874622.1 shikimate dehydrogenase [Pseudomonadales bacterium]MDP4910411.1 shikimate dehydrogenase [Pseudomonadales bacterium]MDP5059378.1 shikimate dehydrogenase [Pseudomonadales bacterium]
MIHQLAVFGHPVAHSKSPLIHQAFASQVGLNVSYAKIDAPVSAFEHQARDFVAAGGRGFNITVPHKYAAFQLADELSSQAQHAQAVNTITVLPDGRLRGDNTDGAGLVTDLHNNLGWTLAARRILVLGAGGAVRGVLLNLLATEPRVLHVWNRTSATATSLSAHFGEPLLAVSTEALESSYDVVINGTSAGLDGRVPAIPASVIGPQTRCYDMVYSNTTTSFNAWCLTHGAAATSDGLGMLVEQAALAFSLWFERQVKTQPVIQLLRALT